MACIDAKLVARHLSQRGYAFGLGSQDKEPEWDKEVRVYYVSPADLSKESLKWKDRRTSTGC